MRSVDIRRVCRVFPVAIILLMNVPSSGRTQIAAGSRTVLGIGPGALTRL
jgi:peptidyl-tRNA hydrolase